jgi:gliding motility-associated-like protein
MLFRSCFLLALLALSHLLPAQNFTFDTSTEGWTTNSDGSAPVWEATGGNPGGWISAFDISTGGTWHWVAPPIVLGNVCSAYGALFQFDLKTSENQNNNSKPDVILLSDNFNLVFNTPSDPNPTWTHYEVTLREDAGWRINTVNGQVPTKAQFLQVLTNLTGLQIRGEYISSSEDEGGLDNVLIQYKSLNFDLDENDSTTPLDVLDFRSDTLCGGSSLLVDNDLLLQGDLTIDSIVIQLVNALDGVAEKLVLPPPLPTVGPTVAGNGTQLMVLRNAGQTTTGLFREVLRRIEYQNSAVPGQQAVRLVQVTLYTPCGDFLNGQAQIVYFPTARAGNDANLDLCSYSGPANLLLQLGGGITLNGAWEPALADGSSNFDPAVDTAGVYRYVVPGVAECPGDTAAVQVRIGHAAPNIGPDTTLCRPDLLTLLVQPPQGLQSWSWSNGSTSTVIRVGDPGTYTLRVTTEIANCTFWDSLSVDVVTCTECPVYVPNAFSPNDDGENDSFAASAGCPFLNYYLRVFDRWGNLVFETRDPDEDWQGTFRSKALSPGVFVWLLDYDTELLGEPLHRRRQGDVTLVK